MIKMTSLLIQEDMKKISLQKAMDNKFFGPVYHGTNADRRELIDKEGFKIFYGTEQSGNISNGYSVSGYSAGIPAPIHHLGFGIYLTTVKIIAKQFSGGTTKGMKTYFIDAPRLETINFGSPHKMMKWWIDNGYDYDLPENKKYSVHNPSSIISEERLRATIHMTEYLKSRYDAVWFKGKSIRRLLDGDQVCVYNPENIYQFDKALIQPGEIGSMVIAKVGIDPYNRGEILIPMGTKGIIIGKEKTNEFQTWAAGSDYIYSIKFDKGGKQYNILDKWIEPYVRK